MGLYYGTFCFLLTNTTDDVGEEIGEKKEINKPKETKCNLILITFISFEECNYTKRQ